MGIIYVLGYKQVVCIALNGTKALSASRPSDTEYLVSLVLAIVPLELAANT